MNGKTIRNAQAWYYPSIKLCFSFQLLHCLGKLFRMNVTVQHLQATGIGRTVNQLRKDDGEVGAMAKELVSKWKEMVAADESSECSEDDDDESAEDPDETSGNETERSPNQKRVEKAVHERRGSDSSDSQRVKSENRSHHHLHQKQENNYEPRTKSNVEDERGKGASHWQHQNGHRPNRETSYSQRHHSTDAVSASSSRSNRKHSDESYGANGNHDHDDTRAGEGTSADDVQSENERPEKDHSSSHGRSERNHKPKPHHGHDSAHHSSGRAEKAEREHHSKHSSHKSGSSSSVNRESSHKDRPSSSSKSDRNNSSKIESDRKHSERSKNGPSPSDHKRKIEQDPASSHGESSSQENGGEMNASKRQKCDTNTSSSRREHKKSSKSSKHEKLKDAFEIDHSMGTSFADALGKSVDCVRNLPSIHTYFYLRRNDRTVDVQRQRHQCRIVEQKLIEKCVEKLPFVVETQIELRIDW